MLFREKLRFYLIGVQCKFNLSSNRLQLFIRLKKKIFSHEPNENKHQSRFDLRVMVCNPWIDF